MTKSTGLVVTATTLLVMSFLWPASALAQSELSKCLGDAFHTADDSVTVGELRTACASKKADDTSKPPAYAGPVYEASALEERREAIERSESRPFVLTPHKPSYLLLTYNSEPNQAPYIPATGVSEPLKDTELKFQFSIKAPIWLDMFESDSDLYFAYSSTSWWQAFNDDLSAPFRETNYEPEVFIRNVSDSRFLGMNIAGWQLGFNHQSNGQTEPLSRSWNRILAQANVELTSDLAVQLRTWYRIPESSEVDDNPLIYRYLGYGDIRTVWAPNNNTFTAMVRPAPEKTSFEVTWSYPISRVFRVYAQYYNGYGESLIDYNFDTERLGIGIAFNDYLMRQ